MNLIIYGFLKPSQTHKFYSNCEMCMKVNSEIKWGQLKYFNVFLKKKKSQYWSEWFLTGSIVSVLQLPGTSTQTPTPVQSVRWGANTHSLYPHSRHTTCIDSPNKTRMCHQLYPHRKLTLAQNQDPTGLLNQDNHYVYVIDTVCPGHHLSLLAWSISTLMSPCRW